ncbi:MAG: polyprenyl synthetase family protein [Acidobacteriota bacterium]|nr:polyprenyl synthetase family protein [Acidobacteriota bacterium]
MTPLAEFLVEQQHLVDAALDRLTPPPSALPETIHKAMRYSLFAGGKRIRPILCLQAAAAVSGASPEAVPGAIEAACSLEMIHTYSLIHDDLPALDNDDYRRGKPTCHKVFGDAMAILAGDSLFTLAIQTLTIVEGLDRARQVQLIRELSFASGTVEGMIGGQVTDIEGERQTPTAELLDRIHRAKTGALLRASVRMGAICGGADSAGISAISAYGEHVGLAFQIVDDILDVEESSESLGKTAGKDAAQGKITFPAVYGLDRSRAMAADQCAMAHEALRPFGESAYRLHEIADLIVHRKS